MAANSFPTLTTNGFTRPRQKLTSAQKTKGWREDCVRYFTSQPYQELSTGRNSKMEKQVNYNLKNSIIDPQQFEYVTDSLGLGGQFGGNPAQLVMKNLVGPKIDRLTSEEMMRPFNWMARGIGGAVLTARQEEKRRLMGEYLTAMYTNIQQGGGGTPQELEQQGVKLPPSIEKYMQSEYLDPREVTANQILEYLIKSDKLPQKFNTMFTDALISSEEYGYISIRKGHPSLRVTNPLNFRFPYNQETQWVQDCEWGVEEQWLMPSQVMDLYGEFLTELELQNLDDGDLGTYFNGNNGSIYSDLYSPAINALRPSGGVLVQTCGWAGWEKVGFYSYPDPKTGEWQKTQVDDSFTIPKGMALSGATLEWEWRIQMWTGTKIGRDTIVDVRPLDFQLGKLPWVGFIHNNRNAKATSIIDICKEDQFTYMIVWWKLEMELARHKGKRMVYDTSMLPTTGPNAMSMDQFIYYGESLGVVFYNSKSEVNGRPSGGNQGGNMFQEVNLSGDGSYIQSLLLVLSQIEGRIDALTGVSRQREGDVKASESATGVNAAIGNSSMVTEPWFFNHNLVKGEALTMLVEVAKEAYKDGASLPLVVDEAYTTLLKVDGETFPDSHYGVFITNSSKDFSELQEVKGYFMAAVQKGLLPMSSIAEAVKAKSPEQMIAAMKKGEQLMQQNQQASAQAQQQHEQQLEALKTQTLQAQWNNDNGQKELDRQNKIQVATISSLKGKDGPTDMDGNGIPDPIDQAELALKLSAHSASMVAQEQKASLETQKAGLSHLATMKKLELETTKLGIEASKANLQQAQFTREQNQQDHAQKLETKAHQQEASTKTRELSLKAQELNQKAQETKLKTQLEKAKLQQEAREAGIQRAHEHSLQDKKGKLEIAKVKLKPKPTSSK